MISSRLRWPLLAGGLLPLLLAARIPSTPAHVLLRAGEEAFDRGAYAEAAALYERAAERTTDPGLVAYNLAAARYQLARAGNTAALAEAEQAYRCCISPGSPRRAQALYGLGNCLLLRAAAVPDGAVLRSAIDRFTQCLRDPGCDPGLAADARHNRQRARLLLLQTPGRQSGEGEDAPPGEDPREEPSDPSGATPERQPGAASPERPDDQGTSAAAEKDPQQSGDQPGKQSPGRGAVLPPVTVGSDAARLGQQDAVEHLEQATRRILEEMRQHRRSRARPAGPGVRDW